MNRAHAILALVALSLCSGLHSTAHADYGDGAGVGFVLASGDTSWSLGWEISGTFRYPFVKASLGGIYDLDSTGNDPAVVHYVAWEPWLLVGGTLGIAYTDRPAPIRLAYGLWEGFPVSLTTARRREPVWAITLAVGLRGFGSDLELYITPKLWRYVPYEFNS